MGPLEAGAGQQPRAAAIKACMQAVAVELDFVQALVAFRRPVDQPQEVRPNSFRQNDGGCHLYLVQPAVLIAK
jgi:hypothetical protein